MAIQTAILALLLDEEDNENSTTTKEIWVRPWLYNRRNSGAFHVLFSDLKLDNHRVPTRHLFMFFHVFSKFSIFHLF